MTDERRQRILQIADELESQGLTATNSSVYARALGHRGHVVTVMKARRAERAAAGGVAVVEEEDEEPTAEEEAEVETPAATIAEDLAQLEHAYEAWHLALERLWQIEQDGPLSEANFARKQWLEYQMIQNLRTQEQLRPALEHARLREAVHAAQTQHDEAIPEARTLAEQVLQQIATLGASLEDLADLFQRQVDGFFAPRDRQGHQAFDVDDGATYVRRLVSALFPQDFRAPAMVEMLLRTPPREGNRRAALADCARLQPFSVNAISAYLNAMTAQPEGTSNGNHA